MRRQLGFWFSHLVVLAYTGVLLGGFLVQFGRWEYPCPLCMLQRAAMVLCALGPGYVIARARRGEVTVADLATGYGMSVVAAVAGATISARQILLHIKPPDPGYGAAVLGLHLYTWAFITFVVMLLAAGLVLLFARELAPGRVEFGSVSWAVLGLFGVIVAANAVAVFALEGFHWVLPDDPDRYQLFYDLGVLP
ncbi:hypothetical protein GCM10012275_29720 [Longimycelium tulufanense]|uniref:Disulfide bond formation protein B n=1 Tax=Longimycelium tulufanense TaxID=907463 RepID=A0A8J3C8W1_9PSEU|nr:disulfide bond formation protein B [Longimycelium tulufanense]GGM56606.1 hypothetical protein GCM10012275_29720 [Longimycelium tulufanense]